MLKASKIQLNRYQGLDSSKVLIVSEEVATLKMLEELNLEKERITAYNKLNHVDIKGFSANFHNFNRSRESYSIAESLFRDQLEGNQIKDFLHEHAVSVKDSLGKTHLYHLDFFIPSIKTAIEISPLFHYTYQTVAIRDKLRTSLLKRKHHINTLVIKVHFRTRRGRLETYLNPNDVKTVLRTVRKQLRGKPSKETILYWSVKK